MMLKIETVSAGPSPGLRLVGRIRADELPALRSLIREHGATWVDLGEVALVDVDSVRFLVECEDGGIELIRCAPYIREWMRRERA
jgi:hypothetical protein